MLIVHFNDQFVAVDGGDLPAVVLVVDVGLGDGFAAEVEVLVEACVWVTLGPFPTLLEGLREAVL